MSFVGLLMKMIIDASGFQILFCIEVHLIDSSVAFPISSFISGKSSKSADLEDLPDMNDDIGKATLESIKWTSMQNNIWKPDASIIIFIRRPTKLIKKPPKRIVNVAFLLVIFAHFMVLLFRVLLFKLINCLAKSFIKNY